MKFGSLFTGIGGMDLGLERAGMDCSWQVEVDEYCRAVLEKHWPDVTRYEDIKGVDFNHVPMVDVLAGGFPCQPVSIAGRRNGEEDDRWLWPYFKDAISKLGPRYIIVENVTGLLNRGMSRVLADLADCGYDSEWYRIPATLVGAPHRRWRIFIISYPGSRRHRASQEPLLPRWGQPELQDWWQTEPGVGRVADGLPNRVDRLRSLGNAVVPQIAEFIGCAIMRMEDEW